jgi:hypothetical protein
VPSSLLNLTPNETPPKKSAKVAAKPPRNEMVKSKSTVLKPGNKTNSRDFLEKPGNLAVLFVRALEFGC